jgi:hypothetical protein
MNPVSQSSPRCQQRQHGGEPGLERGFNVFLPVYDRGVDFVLYREGDSLVRKVQLKSRWTIEPEFAVAGSAGRMVAPSLPRLAPCMR